MDCKFAGTGYGVVAGTQGSCATGLEERKSLSLEWQWLLPVERKRDSILGYVERKNKVL